VDRRELVLGIMATGSVPFLAPSAVPMACTRGSRGCASDGLKPRAAPQSHCVPPTSVCPLLRGPSGGLGVYATGCFGAMNSRQRMSLMGQNRKFADSICRHSFEI